MRKMYAGVHCLLLGALTGAMIARPEISLSAATKALSLFAGKVLPALMPQLFLMLLFSSRVSARGAAIVPMAWLCGSPGGARLISRTKSSVANAKRLYAATGTLSPAFFLGTLGALTGNQAASRAMLFCHLLSAALTALFFRGDEKRAPPPPSPLSLAQAADNAARAMLSVCVLMTVASVASSLAAALLPLPSGALTALQCALEVTGGVARLAELPSPLKYPLLCAACSFGGLSVILQTAAYGRDQGVSLGCLVGIRLLHAAIAFLLCFLLFSVVKLS